MAGHQRRGWGVPGRAIDFQVAEVVCGFVLTKSTGTRRSGGWHAAGAKYAACEVKVRAHRDPGGSATSSLSLPLSVADTLPSSRTYAKMPNQHSSAAERLRRLEEAKAFVRVHLAAGPQPARRLLRAARAAGIATRQLHRAKDALGVRPERLGGYGAHGQWTWYLPEGGGPAAAPSVILRVLTGERS
jgi:hypothetical protein